MTLLRLEQETDQAASHAVHASAFPTAVEARLVDALRAAGRLTVSLVAVDVGQVVGHVALSPVTVAGAADGLGLAPVAVLPAHQRHGIGGRLVTKDLGQRRASAPGLSSCWARRIIMADSDSSRQPIGG
ncbi:MAG: N-acetyltransferase [Gemmataceae bacterium]|nr:N-acetyltransferase [Gemmataceae bacterium]MCI0741319.1 N-acetyltransferase [Gemmataceae bacterium]